MAEKEDKIEVDEAKKVNYVLRDNAILNDGTKVSLSPDADVITVAGIVKKRVAAGVQVDENLPK